MGYDYHIYRPKNKLSLVKELELIEKSYSSSIKNQYSEYCIEFNLKEIHKFHQIKEKWSIKNNNFYLANRDFVYNVDDLVHIIKKKNIFQWCFISSPSYGDEANLGFQLRIDTDENDLVFLIGLPYKDLEKSKTDLYNLFIQLTKYGIYLGVNDYDDSRKNLDQFIDLNSSTKPSETWQLNLSHHSFSHGNGYAINSKYQDENLSTYRLTEVKVGFSKYHFKHNDINEYSVKVLKALSLCFDDLKINPQFRSSNSNLINEIEQLKKGKFNLYSEIILEENSPIINATDIDDLFEIMDNRLMVGPFKLDESHNFFVKLHIEKEGEADSEFKIFITCTHDDELEKHFKSEVEKKLNIELEYIGAE